MVLQSAILATRPWSFTAAALPVAFTAVLQGQPFLSATFARAFGMGIFTQAGANLVNTYVDYKKGLDTKEDSGDRTIVDGVVTPTQTAILASVFFGLSMFCSLPTLLSSLEFVKIFGLGSALSIVYTAPPLSLKYYALGDFTIAACFGPIIMQACSVMFTGAQEARIYEYSIPIMLMTDAILVAGNSRDIESDPKGGCTTTCSLLGFNKAKALYQACVYGAYASCAGLAYFKSSPGLLLPLVTLPLAVSTCNGFVKGRETMQSADERTAQLHMPFGLLMIVGLALQRYFS
jgi:1,4-dihydroxy-2-naphthoate octaprenyltransferase